MYSFIPMILATWECYGKQFNLIFSKYFIRFQITYNKPRNHCHSFFYIYSFRNGSLVRDIFKRSEANNDWNNFSELLESTPRGNYDNMALHFVQKEIIPPVKGSLRWNKTNDAHSPESAKGIVK